MMVSLRATISGFTLSRSTMIFAFPLMKPHFGAADEKGEFFPPHLHHVHHGQTPHSTLQPRQESQKKEKKKNSLPFFFFFSSSSFLSVSISCRIGFAWSWRENCFSTFFLFVIFVSDARQITDEPQSNVHFFSNYGARLTWQGAPIEVRWDFSVSRLLCLWSLNVWMEQVSPRPPGRGGPVWGCPAEPGERICRWCWRPRPENTEKDKMGWEGWRAVNTGASTVCYIERPRSLTLSRASSCIIFSGMELENRFSAWKTLKTHTQMWSLTLQKLLVLSKMCIST